LLSVHTIIKNGVNAPFADQWFSGSSVDIALRAATRDLRFTDLLNQNFDHRIFFTHLTTAILVSTTHWNLKVEMFVSIFLTLCSFLLIVAASKRNNMPGDICLLPLFSALMFSTSQRYNWLWGFETQWFFALLFLSAALWMIKRARISYLTLFCVVSMCCCSTFSFGAGILSWPLAGLGLWLAGYRRLSYFVVFLAAAILTFAAFFHDYHLVGGTLDPRALTLKLFSQRLFFALSFLGSALVPHRHDFELWAVVIGAVVTAVVLANILYLRRRGYSWRDLTTWLVLAGYSLGSALLLARSFRALNVTAALAPRFVTNSTPLILAFVGTSIWTFREVAAHSPGLPAPRWHHVWCWLNATILGSILVLFVVASIWWRSHPMLLASESEKQCLIAFPRTRDTSCLALFMTDPEGSRRIFDMLAQQRLTAFAEAEVRAVHGRLSNGAHGSSVDDDFVFDVATPAAWDAANIVPETGNPGVWRVGTDPMLVYRKRLDLPLKAYSQLRVTLAAVRDIRSRHLQIFYQLEGEQQFTEEHSLHIHLVPGSERTEYCYDLRTLGFKPEAKLVGFRLDPVDRDDSARDPRVEITDLRLSGATGRPDC